MNWNDIVNNTPKLSHGYHNSFGPELCFMEMTAFLAGEDHSDRPRCASPVLTSFGIRLNDSGQPFRDALAPLVVDMIGTANPALERERLEYLIFNVSKRIVAPLIERRVSVELAQKILDCQTLEEINAVMKECRGAAAYATAAAYAADAADVADVADGAYAAARAANAAAADAAANAAADAADAATANADDVPELAAQILSEAIRLDPKWQQAQINPERVEVLAGMAQ